MQKLIKDTLELIQYGYALIAKEELFHFNDFFCNKEIKHRLENIAELETQLLSLPKPRLLRRHDFLFASIQYALIHGFNALSTLYHAEEDDKALLAALTWGNEIITPAIGDYADSFASACRQHFEQTDGALKEAFKAQINVEDKDIFELGRPSLYTKLNHGFWEFFLNSHIEITEEIADEKKLRYIANRERIKGERNSGFYIILQKLLTAFYTADKQSNLKKVEFSIGLSAGNVSCSKVLDKPLNNVARGALKGMLSFMESIPQSQGYIYSDGVIPRNILVDGKLAQFSKQYILDSDICLIIAPAHLKDFKVKGFKGELSFLCLPSSSVHDSWCSVLAACLAQIEQACNEHKKVSVLVQGANFATLLTFAVAYLLNSEQLAKLNLWDLGRVLDICNDDILKRFPSFDEIRKNKKENYDDIFYLDK
jgi:hypothetical protein